MKNTFKSLAIVMAVLSVAACKKENFKEAEPVQGNANTFTCTFDDSKAVAANGVQTFAVGEIIDLMDNSSCKTYPVEITKEMISESGKKVVFTSDFPADKSVLAVYPGGYTAKNSWSIKDDGTHTDCPHFSCMNSKRDGFATAVAGASEDGNGRSLTFTNVVSCVSFASSKTVTSGAWFAGLYGNDGEKIPSQILINPTTGAASAYSTGMMDYAFTNLAATYPSDIRLWMLPGQEFKKGITLKLASPNFAKPENIKCSRVIDTPFTVGANQFIRLGDIDKASEGKVTIEIATAQEFLAQVIQTPHTTIASRDTTYSITADLDFTGIQIVRKNPTEGQYLYAAGEYYANINGNGHKIKNLVSFGPLIQKYSAVAQNIVFDESCTCTLGDNSGGIFLEANYGGIVKNIVNYGTIKVEPIASSDTGLHHGVIMGINRAYVFDCKNYGPVIATLNMKRQDRIGGIIGTHAASPDKKSMVPAETITKNCENSGDITVNITANEKGQLFVGGVFGAMDCTQNNTIANCKNSGKVTINTNGAANLPNAGGLIGMKKAPNGFVIDCENTGDVAVKGALNTSKASASGLLGYRLSGTAGSFATFENCKVNCTVSCDYAEVAGMVLGKGDDAGSDTFTFGSKEAPIEVNGAVNCGGETIKAIVGSITNLKGYTFNVNYGSQAPANCFVVKPGETVTFATVKGNTPAFIDCDAAALLWQDNKDLVKSVSINGSEIKVELNASQEGNAVVTASKGGVVVWSWNIWVLADDVKDVTVCGYTFMDRNVGALTTVYGGSGSIDPRSIGNVYMWGRKDAYAGLDQNGELKAMYDINGQSVERQFVLTEEVNNIPNAIANPMNVYYMKYTSGSKLNTYSWMTNDYTQFPEETMKTLWDNNGKKSIYDPCPTGYKVATLEAWNTLKAAVADGTLVGEMIRDNSYVAPEAVSSKWTGTNAIRGPHQVQFRGANYSGLVFVPSGEINYQGSLSLANFMGGNAMQPTSSVWAANPDPQYSASGSSSYVRGQVAKCNASWNSTLETIALNKLSMAGAGFGYELPVRCIKE